MIKSAN